jgi:hypothetical protein
VAAWFKTFDHLHLSTRFSKNGNRKQGRLPRHRLPASGPRTSDINVYPKKLPQNFYDETWLATLDEFEEAQLQIQDPMELIFDDDIHRYVELLKPNVLYLMSISLAERFRKVRGEIPVLRRGN